MQVNGMQLERDAGERGAGESFAAEWEKLCNAEDSGREGHHYRLSFVYNSCAVHRLMHAAEKQIILQATNNLKCRAQGTSDTPCVMGAVPSSPPPSMHKGVHINRVYLFIYLHRASLYIPTWIACRLVALHQHNTFSAMGGSATSGGLLSRVFWQMGAVIFQ